MALSYVSDKEVLDAYITHITKRAKLIAKHLNAAVFLTDPQSIFTVDTVQITVLGYPVYRKKTISGPVYGYIIDELIGKTIPLSLYTDLVHDATFRTDLFGSVYLTHIR